MKMKKILIFLILALFLNGCHYYANKKPNYSTIVIDSIKPDSIIEPIPIIIVRSTREKLIDSVNAQLYVREITPNRAPMIDIYHETVNPQQPLYGQAWCGVFVGANLTWQGVQNPNSAWPPDYANPKDIIWTQKNKNSIPPLPGDVVTYFYSNLRRVGHTGFYESTDKDGYFITDEGNTNGTGSREGDGVFKKKRDPQKVHAISRYIKE